MLVRNALVLTLLSAIIVRGQCYEEISETKDIYVLYTKDSVYQLKIFSNFHGEYTPFEYNFRLPKDSYEVELAQSSSSLMTVFKKDKHFVLRRKLGPSEYIVKLKRSNCKRLKINKIPKERIIENPYPKSDD